MPTVNLPRAGSATGSAGPAGSPLPPVVFVHGLLVNGEIWTGVAAALAERGIRSYAPDLPLGAHPAALNPGTDLSPRGVAGLVLSFLEALGLTDVTLAGTTPAAHCASSSWTPTSRGSGGWC